VLPALFAMMGATARRPEKMPLGAPVTVKQALALFMPVEVASDDSGQAWARPRPTNGSGDFTALAGTDGFVELPPGPNIYPKGFVTRLYRW
jgi:molybdopterin molybdotransferase